MTLRLIRCTASSALLLLLSTDIALAAGGAHQVTIDAGKHDRTNTPVCVLLVEAEQQANLNPAILAKARSAVLTDEKGQELPAQITQPGLLHSAKHSPGKVVRELHFIVPNLKKGESITLTARLSDAAPSTKGFSWKDTPGESCELSFGDRPVMRYMYKPFDLANRGETMKVYHHLFDPTGTRLVTKGDPGGLYPHHRGLFFGYCNITFNGGRADTWGCGNAHQLHERFVSQEAGPVLGRHIVQIAWRTNANRTFLTEYRELTVYNTPDGNLVEFATRLVTADGKVKLDGNAPHAGFQFRAAQEVAEKTEKQTYYLRPDGKGPLGKAVASAKDLPWDALSFVLGDDRYTVAYLDKPTNPKPVEYNERTYGRFGSFFRYDLDDGKDLEANYRIWLQRGEVTLEQVSALADDFAEPVTAATK